MKKLSQMNFEEGALAVGTLSMSFANILENEKIDALIKETLDFESFIKKDEHGNCEADYKQILKMIASGGAKILTRILGLLLKENFKDVVEIVSLFSEQTAEEVRKMNVIEVTKILKEIFKDEDLIILFTSVQKEKNLDITE
ncbi:MAG: hypothetical protein RR664_06390 [Clostridia bacterium]